MTDTAIGTYMLTIGSFSLNHHAEQVTDGCAQSAMQSMRLRIARFWAGCATHLAVQPAKVLDCLSGLKLQLNPKKR